MRMDLLSSFQEALEVSLLFELEECVHIPIGLFYFKSQELQILGVPTEQ